MKKLILFSAFFLFVGSQLKAEGIEFHHDKSFQELLDMAKAENKLIFMDCYTSWCGPCKRLSAMVFPDSAVGAYFNEQFINCKFDMEKDEGIMIAGKYSIRAYPTLLWIDGSGEVKHKVVGGLDPNGLIQNGRQALDPTPGILSGMHRQYNEGNREVNFLSDFVNTMNKAGENYSEVFKIYMEKLTEKDLNDPKHTKTVFNLTKDIHSPGLDYVLKNKAYYSGLIGAEAYNSKINQLADKATAEAVQKKDADLFHRALELVKQNKGSDAHQKALELGMDYYSQMNDWSNYDKQATQYIKKYASKNAPAINNIAWNYYINVNDKAQLTKASKWAFEALNMDNRYTYNLTYAYLLYKLNDLKESEKACDYAILRANDENVQPTSANALKEAIAKATKP